MEGQKFSILVHIAPLICATLVCLCTLADATIIDFFCRPTQSEPLINPTRQTARYGYHDLVLFRLWRFIRPEHSLNEVTASNLSRILVAILDGDCIGTLLSNDLIITTAKCATKYTDEEHIQHLRQYEALLRTVRVVRGDAVSPNAEAAIRIVDSVHLHPHGIDIAYIRLKKEHLEPKEADNPNDISQPNSKLSMQSPIGVMVNTNSKLPRPIGVARAVVMDNTQTAPLSEYSYNEQVVTGTIRTSDFPVVPTSKCRIDQSMTEGTRVTDESYLCRLNEDAHSNCGLQVRYDNCFSSFCFLFLIKPARLGFILNIRAHVL